MRQGALRLALVAATAGMLGACSLGGSVFKHNTTTAGFSSAKSGPASTQLVSTNASIPKGGGHYMVGDPYSIAGKTYIPHEDPGYSQVGEASWYGFDFHGRETANGEIYDLDGVTAAHPTMPLPSYARVTNLENGRSITVRINDRGPFADNRIIDVSRTVARMLDFEDAGTAKVKVDYIGPAPLEGDDTPKLLASYSEPGSAPAFGRGSPVQVASAVPAPVSKPATPVATIASTAPMSRPAPITAGDPIAPVIARSGTSYTQTASLSPAQQAAEVLGRPDLSTQLAIAAAKRAAELGLRGPVAP